MSPRTAPLSPCLPRSAVLVLLAALGLTAARPVQAQTVPVTYLYGSGTDAHDNFGAALALHDSLLLVGAPFDGTRPGPYLGGRTYVFRRDREEGTWAEEDVLLPYSDRQQDTGFGAALSLSPDGSVLLVGAYRESYTGGFPEPPVYVQHGGGYVFRYDEDAGEWMHEAKLRPSGLEDYAKAGTAVAVAGELAALNGDWNGRGLVVFRHTPDADTAWTEETTFTTGTTAGFLVVRGDRNLAVMDHPVEGERVLGGAYWEARGTVYVYRNDGPASGPAAWTLEAQLEPWDAASSGFGADIALSADGRLLVVGAYGFCQNGPGRAYVYRREGDGAQSVWIEEAILTPPVLPLMRCFGAGVSLSEDPATGEVLALIGSSGRATLFRREGDGSVGFAWAEVLTFEGNFDGGTPVLSGLVAAAGNEEDETLGEDAGRALVFDLVQAVPVESGPEGALAALSLSAYPNPSRGAATLALVLPERGRVQVALYDVLGRRVALLHEGLLTAGAHRLMLDGSGLAPGVYLARAETAAGAVTTRLAVVR